MQFELVSPESRIASFEADSVELPGSEGDMTVMADHASLVTTLRPGFIRARSNLKTTEHIVTGGFVEVTAAGVSVLAERVVPAAEATAEVFKAIAEDEENSPWEPLHVERGFSPDASTVTLFTSLGPTQMESRPAGTAEAMLTGAIDSMMGFGHGHGELLLMVSQEHGGFFRAAGWDKAQVREFVHQRARRTAGEWAGVYKGEVPPAGSENDMVPVLLRPESLVLLAGGGPGGPWSCLVPRWSKGVGSHSVSREIDMRNL